MSESSVTEAKSMRHHSLSETVRATVFSTPDGITETYVVVRSRARDRFEKAVSDLQLDYRWALQELGGLTSQPMFVRLYLSDIVNQLPILENAGFPGPDLDCPVAVVEQRPLLLDEMILFAYHILAPDGRKLEVETLDAQGWQKACRVRARNYEFIWGANFSHRGNLDSFDQTAAIFDAYNSVLNSAGMNMLGSSVRTWIYVRDIDNHYAGMVEARKLNFETHGLNRDTRYIASTGIEAKLANPSLLVSMDFLNIHRLNPKQIVRMEALEHLGPTIDYGVTFERGTKVVFGDRCHLFISGTASIDPSGTVLHPQDPHKQALRAVENIAALLRVEDCGLSDVAYFIAYVRNPGDRDRVQSALESVIPPDIPFIFVEGSVCRPTWLVEVECVAIKARRAPFPEFA